MINNEFDNEIKYRLFRSVQEILHPKISKKNISDYKVIIDENILPVRVFYPKRVSTISKIAIFIRGNGKVTDCQEMYSDICKNLALEVNLLVIAIEYEEEKNAYKKMYKEIYDTVKYLYERLEKDNVSSKDIILMGDSTGANILTAINELNDSEIAIDKEVLFYPVLSSDYKNKTKYESFTTNNNFNFNLLDNLNDYFNFIAKEELSDPILNPLSHKAKKIPKTLLLSGKIDSLLDENEEYKNLYKSKVKNLSLAFASHGFLKKMDQELATEVYDALKEFIYPSKKEK